MLLKEEEWGEVAREKDKIQKMRAICVKKLRRLNMIPPTVGVSVGYKQGVTRADRYAGCKYRADLGGETVHAKAIKCPRQESG